VIKVGVTSTSTLFEPRTSSTATTGFAGFLDGNTVEAWKNDHRCCGWFAGLHALKPLMINIPVAVTPTVLKPGAPRSTATDSA